MKNVLLINVLQYLFVITIIMHSVNSYSQVNLSAIFDIINNNCDFILYGVNLDEEDGISPDIFQSRVLLNIKSGYYYNFLDINYPRLRVQFCNVISSEFTVISSGFVRNLLNVHGFDESTAFFLFTTSSKEFDSSSNLRKISVRFDAYTSGIHLIIRQEKKKNSQFFGADYSFLKRMGIRSSHPFTTDHNECGSNLNNMLVAAEIKGRNCVESHRLWPCTAYARMILAAKKSLNFTLNFMSYKDYSARYTEEGNLIISTFISHDSYVQSYRSRSSSSLTFILKKQIHFLLYCEDELIFRKTSYYYWISPFSDVIWGLLALSVLAILVVTKLFPGTDLCELGFWLAGILLRQDSTRRMTPLLLIFSWCSFVLMTSYESLITRDLTVPPNPIVARSLKELIVERGYKMLYPFFGGREVLARFDLHEFKRGFEKYNLSYIFWNKIRGYELKGDSHYKIFSRRGTNVAADIPDSVVNLEVLRYNKIASTRHCHTAKEPFFERYYSVLTRGRGFRCISQFMEYTRQVGLINHWTESWKWLKNYVDIIKINKSSSNLKNDGNDELSMRNEKMLQLFQILVRSVGLSAASFVIEFLVSKKNAVVHLTP